MKEVFSRAFGTINRARNSFEEQRLLRKEPDHVYMIEIGKEGIDANNHLANSRYLDLGDQAAAAMLEERGIGLKKIAAIYGLSPFKRAVTSIEWKSLLKEGDLARVCTDIRGIGNTSIRLRQWVELNHQFSADLGDVTYVMVDSEGVPARVPEEVRAKLSVKEK